MADNDPQEPEEIEQQQEEDEEQSSQRVSRKWMTPTEAMDYLGVSRTTLYHLMDTGVLKFYVLRGVQKRRIRKEDLDALFEEGRPQEEEKEEKPRAKRKGKTRAAKR